MKLLSATSHLRPKPKFPTIGKAGRSIPVDCCRIYFIQEAPGIGLISRKDRIRVVGWEWRLMCAIASPTSPTTRMAMQSRMYSSAPILRDSAFTENQTTGFLDLHELNPGIFQLLHNPRNVFSCNITMHQQLLSRVADQRPLRLGVNHNRIRHIRSAEVSMSV